MTEKIRILTIEDDPTVRMNIVAYLEDSGYEMVQAADGLEGLNLFKERQPNLVLCDLRMPKSMVWRSCRKLLGYPRIHR